MSILLKLQKKYERVVAGSEHAICTWSGSAGDTEDFLWGRALRIADHLGRWDEVSKKLTNVSSSSRELQKYVCQLAEDAGDDICDKIAQEIQR